MIVIDASAVAKLVLREDGWEEVLRYVKRTRPLYSVDHALKEVANAIWKHAMRGVVAPDLVARLYGSLEKLAESQVLVLEGELGYMERAVEIALKHGITVYDALYLAQAEKYGELVTADEKQGRVAKELGITVHML